MNDPIFVRGMSRSGGTMMVTLLDAHPQIAMIYEFYPNLLMDAGTIDIEEVISTLEQISDIRKAAKQMPTSGLSKLITRLPRARLDTAGLAKLLREHLTEGLGFEDPSHRLRLIERCGLHNMHLEGKPLWGSKCGTNFEDYSTVWPNAKFINIIRDGRDVLASQLNTGDFKVTPSSLGKSWSKNHIRFRRLIQDGRIRGHEVIYERFVTSPNDEVKKLLNFIEVDEAPSILDFYKQSLNIYDVGHMSVKALEKPINASQVGRWEKDLSDAQIDEFLSESGTAMREFGYIAQ